MPIETCADPDRLTTCASPRCGHDAAALDDDDDPLSFGLVDDGLASDGVDDLPFAPSPEDEDEEAADEDSEDEPDFADDPDFDDDRLSVL
ncbi:MAG TPA: hypothetical protein VNB24_04785 [Acidimicrobiales bacterium]|nr:hypothetical protein [Acidimicrobiales bacterium]